MKLVRLYAWACVIALPPILGMGILYLFIDGRLGVAGTVASTFAIVCVYTTAILLSSREDPDSEFEVAE